MTERASFHYDRMKVPSRHFMIQVQKFQCPDFLIHRQFYRLSFFNRLELRQGKRFQTVFAQDILYAEADNKQIKLHLFDRVEDYNYLLRDFESLLPAGLFFRVQRSYLVNLQYIDSYDAKSVTLKNGETLPLKSKEFQKAYHNFMFLVNH